MGASPERIPLRDMWRPRNYRYAGLGLIFVHRHLVHKKWGVRSSEHVARSQSIAKREGWPVHDELQAGVGDCHPIL